MIDIEKLTALFSYDPETGLVSRKSGAACGWRNGGDGSSNRYLRVTLPGRVKVYLHHIAWALTFREWPDQHIDHINGNQTDNRMCNLRLCTPAQNARNTGQRSHSKQPYKGIRKSGGRWHARIRVDKKEVFLGAFGSAEEAHAAYCLAARQYHGEFARFQ